MQPRKRTGLLGAFTVVVFLLSTVILSGATCWKTNRHKSGPAPELGPPGWASTAVGYEIFVRSFFDSDSDGAGDLAGIAQRLDHLNDGKPGAGTWKWI